MASQSAPSLPSSRPVQPSAVQTSFQPTLPSSSIPTSAVSASSVAASSQMPSPLMSPQAAATTGDTSIQNSPDGLQPGDAEIPPLAELPESVISRRSSHSAMSEAVAISKAPGIIRRLSNKASKFAAGRRRQSSVAANSRDHSSGPVIMRRRSDSNSTAPELRPAVWTESEDEHTETIRTEIFGKSVEGPRDYFSSSSSVSLARSSRSSNDTPGPVIPAELLQGTVMLKVSKKKRKLLTFTLDQYAAKVSWDKSRTSKQFYIDDIKEIRSGPDARNYRLEFGVPARDESKFFSILYAVPEKRVHKLMHLIAGDEKTYQLWTTTLDAVSKHRQHMMVSLSSFNEKAVKHYWRREMDKQFGDRPHTDAQEQIDFVGVERLCKSLHIHGVYGHLRTNFIKADLTKSGRLSYSEFQNFINLMKAREEIRWIFYERAKRPEVGMTLNEFLSFLHECQGEDVHNNRSHWDFVFNMFTGRRPQAKGQPTQEEAPGGVVYMNESALTAFLTSKFNLPIKETPAQYSLDRPLHEYYISSSHNTYLLGRQVAGQSSVEAYISALQGGCRCVEIDCWDGADGPVVMHGRTLTSQVSFADVMTTISKYAFVKSPFPLILSLEVHCSRQQQATMADIIKRTCGSRLVTEPLDPTTQQLPSPSQLLNKILIKVKMPGDDESGPLDSPLGRRRGASVSSPYMRPVADATPLLAEKQLYSPPGSPKLRSTTVKSVSSSKTTLVTESQESLHSSTSENESTSEEPPRTKQSNIVKVLGELGVYTAGVKFHGFETAESKTYNHVYSFMESTFARNSKTQDSKRALVRHNMRYLMRVYPNGWRVSSTNFNPLAYWRRGVQMAALNWQTYDLGMQFNDAMFAGGTDASGYVLKPSGLRQITMMTAIPEAAGPTFAKRERKIVKFSIEVISAQQLMRPKTLPPHRTFDPYVEVEVYHADDKTKQLRGVVGEGGHDDSGLGGSSGLGTPRRLRTQIVSENGFNPIFNKSFQFELTTKYPELVFVRWTVRVSRDGHNYDDRSAPLAIYTAKLSNLKEGYRTLPLNDSNGDRWLFSTLFCRTKIHETTSIYVDQAAETINKLKALGRTILSKTNSSPKSSSDHIHQL